MTEDGTPGGVATVGDALRASREAQGLSLEAVAERTRVPRRHLHAIETSDYAALPAVPYAVGFVKSYARAIGVPAEEAGRDFRVELNAADYERPERYEPAFEPTDPARVPPRWLAVAALVVAVLFVGGYVLWRSGAFGGDTAAQQQVLAAGENAPTPAPAPAAPGSVAPAPAAASPATAGPVVITAVEPAWIRVSDGDRRLFMATMKPGDRFEVPAAAAAPVIRTGAPQAIRITVGDRVAPPLGPPSTLVRSASLRPADLFGGGGGAASAPAPSAPMTTSPSDRPSAVHRPVRSIDPRTDVQAPDPNAIVPPPAASGNTLPPTGAAATDTAPATPGA